jgi:hypothetical protein
MKTLMNSFAGLAFTLLGALSVISCDPCSGVVCNNGTCSNGTCVCEDGYERNNSSCVAVNELYVGTGTVTAKTVAVDAGGNATTSTRDYDLIASATNPYVFTLVKFNGSVKDDISFTISPTNYDIVLAETGVTAAGNSYSFYGARVGSQVQLTITDTSDQKVYTVSFVA